MQDGCCLLGGGGSEDGGGADGGIVLVPEFGVFLFVKGGLGEGDRGWEGELEGGYDGGGVGGHCEVDYGSWLGRLFHDLYKVWGNGCPG